MPEGESLEQEVMNRSNGHDPEADEQEFAGGHMTLDGRDRKVMTMDNRQYASVLQQLLHAIDSSKEYRQQLARARWKSDEECDDWCNAYDECERHGSTLGKDLLINRLIGRGAGVNGWLIDLISKTISHSSYTVNSNNQKTGAWNWLRRNGNNGNRDIPPL